MITRHLLLLIVLTLITDKASCTTRRGDVDVLCHVKNGEISFLLKKNEIEDSVKNIDVLNDKGNKIWELHAPYQVDLGEWKLISYGGSPAAPNGKTLVLANKLREGEWYEVRWRSQK